MLLEAKHYRQFLNDELLRKLKINPRYSMRSFAKQLGLSPGELSEILRNKRALSVKGALRISKNLGLTDVETQHLLMLVHREQTQDASIDLGLIPTTEDVSKTKRELSLDMFHIISDWYCYAILNLVETFDFRWDLPWIAKRLGITLHETKTAVDRLIRVGLIEFQNGKYKVTEDYVISPDGIPSEAIRNFHQAMLRKAAEAVEHQSLQEREFAGLTVAVDPKKIPSLKKEIHEFIDKINSRYAKGTKKEVYQLEIGFFRISNRESVGREK